MASLFEQLYAQAILNPGDIEKNIEKLIQEVREQAVQGQAGRSLYGDVKLDPALAQQMINHPLPFWVERMTTAYLRAEGGSVVRDLFDLLPDLARWHPDEAGVVRAGKSPRIVSLIT